MADDKNSALVEELRQQLTELEKQDKKNKREIKRLRDTMDLEKQVAMAKANQQFARSIELRTRERYMKLLLENCPDIILILDNTGRFVYCTDIFLKMTHLNDSDLVNGHTFKDVFSRFAHSAWVEDLYEKFTQALALKKSLVFEETGDIGNDGDVRKFTVQFIPMVNLFGENEGSMLLFHDITEIEKTREEAVHAREEAERASVAKSEFLSNMSHEMRTPMNAIIGMTAIAKNSGELERKNYCLQKIEDASTHLLGVINDILDMSKIEANKLELSHESFSFEKMLRKVVNVINFRIDERHQHFTVHLDDRIPHTLVGDDQRLAQVITNLLSNAVKFTPEDGTIRLDTCLEKEEAGICTIRIEVADSGIGISAEQQGRLFKSFEQAETGTSRKFGGTGLGLAISKRIVEIMGGRIWIESELGKGSVFAFTITAERGKEEERLLAAGVNWSNIRILAIDDMKDIRDYFTAIAGQLHLSCDTAGSGTEALTLIEKNGPYDIYFVDWKMPGMDGIELSRHIRGTKSVVIMISAAEWTAIEDEARKAGVNKFLAKPLFPSSITDCINECLGSRALQDTAEAVDHFEGCTMLLAEDVEINREIVLTLLEPTGLAIDCAENGKVALEMFSADPDKYSIIFMDVQMPEMDGYEATRSIRALEAARGEKCMEFAKQTPQQLEHASVPIVAMTANVFREDVEKCLAAGMNDHVGKPLDMEDMLGKLRRYLNR